MPQDSSPAIDGLPPPVTGPSVWYGPDVERRTDWIHILSSSDVAEVEKAMRPLVACEADIARITKRDFSLPTLGPKLERICSEVVNGRGFALMRGLPVAQWSMRESA